MNESIRITCKANIIYAINKLKQYRTDARSDPGTSKPNPDIENTCFVGGTQIHAEDGIWDIELIGSGDMVLSRCEETGELMYREVIRRFEHEDQETFCVRYENELGEMDWVVTTAGHPFWVKNIGWIKAIDLKEGHELEICDPYQRHPTRDREKWRIAVTEKLTRTWPARVISVTNQHSLRTVYNFEVEGFHTYFVGNFGVLVHNKNNESI
ncbi:polymorphic toxin-type HINT domain-containing protein [Undibacterium sp. TJN19]|uniref:polymorphic toxin-type HINT domain-containing protein n=1 Tax=Undibacterium sp. TJN19 TaxID=3413055 RepID=UPI003BEF80BF